MFDETGPVDFKDVLKQSSRNFDRLIASAGEIPSAETSKFVDRASRISRAQRLGRHKRENGVFDDRRRASNTTRDGRRVLSGKQLLWAEIEAERIRTVRLGVHITAGRILVDRSILGTVPFFGTSAWWRQLNLARFAFPTLSC